MLHFISQCLFLMKGFKNLFYLHDYGRNENLKKIRELYSVPGNENLLFLGF